MWSCRGEVQAKTDKIKDFEQQHEKKLSADSFQHHHRQTDRQMDRWTDRQTDRWADRGTDRQTAGAASGFYLLPRLHTHTHTQSERICAANVTGSKSNVPWRVKQDRNRGYL